jgi:hypothetical protein
MIPFEQDDGGRAVAGFRGTTGDCVTRAIAIAAQRDYREVYDALHEAALSDAAYMRTLATVYGPRARSHASPRTGVPRSVYDPYLEALGFEWTPTMGFGTGCTVHLLPDELPPGRLVVRLSKHVAAVVDGVLHDTYDCSRGGTRCVYGYWRAAP